MYNIPELERKWLSYKIKKTLKPILVLIVLLIITIAILLFIPSIEFFNTKPNGSVKNNIEKIIPTETVTKNNQKTILKTVSSSLSSSSVSPTLSKTKESVKLEPSFNFMYGLEEEVLGYYDEPAKQKEPVPRKPIKSPAPKTTVNTKTKQNSTATSKQIGVLSKHSTPYTTADKENIIKKKSAVLEKEDLSEKLDINRKNDEKDIQDVIKRFKKNKNPALSLFVAKRFYAIGNYQQSYNYALITNELNNDIEDSWLIFAKSLVKLNQKEMAISTLESYIESSRSIKAKLLLDSIRNGTMR